MPTVHPFKRCVVLTRPEKQAQSLSKKLSSREMKIICAPTLRIIPIDSDQLRSCVSSLSDYDYIIFSSPNAVEHMAVHLARQRFSAQLIAAGPGTAKACEIHAWGDAIIPKPVGHVGILALDSLQSVQDKNILICCGQSPHPVLAQTLKRRGAKVTECLCYRREKITQAAPGLFEHLQALPTLPVWQIASRAALDALMEQAIDAKVEDWLRQCPLVVLHPVQKTAAKQWQWQGDVVVADDSSEAGLVTAIKRLCQ